MKEYSVIAEMVDTATGDRKFPGESFTPHDEDQAERLEKSGCIREGRDGAAIQRDQINNDGLFDRTIVDLKSIATTEGVDIGDATRKDQIVAALRVARANT